jgi:hypothetical protein
MNVAHQRCYNHAEREAAARCPECKRFFCRECVSEHDDRVLCAACLVKRTRPGFTKRYHLRGVVVMLQAMVGLVLLWLVFYTIGRILLNIPDTFHEGAVWRDLWQ